jgi:N-acyl-phosphatidylethanolamine-hydrolysing phospholipase D
LRASCLEARFGGPFRIPDPTPDMFLPTLARIAVLLAAGLAIAGCASVNPDYDPAKPHHRPDGFNNRYHDNFAADAPSFWSWQWQRLRNPPPASRPERVPVVRPDLTVLRAPSLDASVTWLGHATALWRVNGLNLLTDPHLTERASPVSFAGPRREVPMPIGLADLPRIDVVLLSHNHYDHLDRATVLALNRQAGGPPLFVVPLGVDLWMRQQGIDRVQRMDWWDTLRVPGPGGEVTLHFVPAQHWSSRSPWDRSATLWGGFVLQAEVGGAPLSMYFAGDTGYSKDFADIGARFGGFDFAQIPVGCYLPRWFMQSQHVNEDEAVQIHRDVGSRFSMGVHWGTFRLCDDPIETPLDELPKARARYGVADDAFVLFALGETRVLRQGRWP